MTHRRTETDQHGVLGDNHVDGSPSFSWQQMRATYRCETFQSLGNAACFSVHLAPQPETCGRLLWFEHGATDGLPGLGPQGDVPVWFSICKNTCEVLSPSSWSPCIAGAQYLCHRVWPVEQRKMQFIFWSCAADLRRASCKCVRTNRKDASRARGFKCPDAWSLRNLTLI